MRGIAPAIREQNEVNKISSAKSLFKRLVRQRQLWFIDYLFGVRGLSCTPRSDLAFPPKSMSNHQRIYFSLLPPISFLCCGVYVTVVYGADRYCELIAHFNT